MTNQTGLRETLVAARRQHRMTQIFHRLLTELPLDEPLTLTVVRGASRYEVEIRPSS